MNRLVDGCDVEVDEAEHGAAGDRLFSLGYASVAKMTAR